MKFVYKIWSGYDGHTPARMAERLTDEGLLPLGWNRYLESVEEGREVWVFYHGPHRFQDGVYVRGTVEEVDYRLQRVLLRPTESSSGEPLATPAITEQVRRLVRARSIQVFVLPEGWSPEPNCSLVTAGDSGCRERRCELCANWKGLSLIEPGHVGYPQFLKGVEEHVPAYWVVPSRCYLHRRSGTIAPGVNRSSNLFYRFKVGEKELAFPLALGVFAALKRRNTEMPEGIVPIPLSPAKAEAGEVHRTRLLADELSLLLDIPVADALSLAFPVSKGSVLRSGGTRRDFERRYAAALEVAAVAGDMRRIVLLDDVATHGSTLRVAAEGLHAVNPDLTILTACAGQMIVKAAVRDETALISAA